MPSTDLLPAIAAVCFVTFLAVSALRAPRRNVGWRFPAALAAVFLAFTVATIAAAGWLGFWDEHVRGWWSNQIWFDLLLAIGTAWSLLLPQARRLGMRPAAWLVLICLSGCIGLLAMYARVRYLQQHADLADRLALART